jgi:hypothetical protein
MPTYDPAFWMQGLLKPPTLGEQPVAQPMAQPMAQPVASPPPAPANSEPTAPPAASESQPEAGFGNQLPDYQSIIDPATQQRLMERANQDPSWGKALSLGALALTQPEMAFRLLEEDEGARQAAENMLTQLGVQETAGKRDWNRQNFLLEMQDKKQIAGEERAKQAAEEASLRGYEDEAARLGGFVKLPTDKSSPTYRKDLIGAVEQGQSAKLSYDERKKSVEAYMRAFNTAKLPPPNIADPMSDEGYAQLQSSADVLIGDNRNMTYLQSDAIRIAEQTGNAKNAWQAYENIKSPVLKEQARGFAEAAQAAAGRTARMEDERIEIARTRANGSEQAALMGILSKITTIQNTGQDNWITLQNSVNDLQKRVADYGVKATAAGDKGYADLAGYWSTLVSQAETGIAVAQQKMRDIEATSGAIGNKLGASPKVSRSSDPFGEAFKALSVNLQQHPIPGFDNTKWLGTGRTTDSNIALQDYLSNQWSNEVTFNNGQVALSTGMKNVIQKLYNTYVLHNGGQGNVAEFATLLRTHLGAKSNDWKLPLVGAPSNMTTPESGIASIEKQPQVLAAIQQALQEATGQAGVATPPPGQVDPAIQGVLNETSPLPGPSR